MSRIRRAIDALLGRDEERHAVELELARSRGQAEGIRFCMRQLDRIGDDLGVSSPADSPSTPAR